MYKHMTNEQFDSKLTQACGKQDKVSADIQTLLIDALHQSQSPKKGGHGSCAKLTKLRHQLAATRKFPMRAINNYIADHTAAKWQVLKDGKRGYKFPEDKKGDTIIPTETYWEHKASNENGDGALTVHVGKRLTMLINDSKKEGNTVDDPELMAKIEALVKQHKAEKKAAQKDAA